MSKLFVDNPEDLTPTSSIPLNWIKTPFAAPLSLQSVKNLVWARMGPKKLLFTPTFSINPAANGEAAAPKTKSI